jgi:hypothetical protein
VSENSQREAIARYLKTGKSITPLEALQKFGCLRLGARIWELKRQGATILKYMARVGRGKEAKRVACYYLLRATAGRG